MGPIDRRTFLATVGAPAALSAVAALPLDLGKVLAIPANNRTGSIRDIEHVVVLMQENRSFDHYLGTLRGVRGFADPHPASLPGGRTVWQQPNGSGQLLPFRPDVPDLGRTFLPDPPHGWNDTHGAWNGGRHDAWVANKGVTTMTYHTREDLPYQYALAEAFTVCDNYRCSLLGPTDPNRYHMWTGWVGNDGAAGGPVITNAEAGYDWSTYPERLERAGISWKVYQDSGVGLDAAGFWGWTQDPFIGNFGDNSLLYFHQYQNAAPGTPLADRAKVGTTISGQGRAPEALLADFRRDVQRGELPAVSWIVAPEAYTEHPNWEPGYGTWYVSQVVDILASNPGIWSRMALFVTYDEEGGFFDHLVPPTPTPGFSTVPVTNEIFPGDGVHPAGPYGLGMRVPMIVVSPWTRGGWVNSQLFDHTSLIKFLETRFGGQRADLVETNITPWRRAVVGDLTSAFDFRTPNVSRRPRLPDTADFKPVTLTRQPDQPPVPPAAQALPAQERGVRPARALPYALHADARPVTGGVRVEFRNVGRAAAVFQARAAGAADAPRTYTVEPGKQLADAWAAPYDIELHGPNGFFRHFRSPVVPPVEIAASYDERHNEIGLRLANHGERSVVIAITDAYTGHVTRFPLAAGRVVTEHRSLSRTRGWYDLTVTAGPASHRYAGHLENGADSITDPILGGLV